ncbi:MAG TPA: malectin domain-containing carbohydrate-binding protein [Bryobacteraceae bacterium]|nr:malectin domain-containing carbohydrate-binding protein [Bryobacteraceae bacterium]
MVDGNQGGGGATGAHDAERLELAAILASPSFARAQRLVKLLEYICEKHFAGRDTELCEYSIATEVLGRPADFDPGEDAIARVEIHRLRKKLREYYTAEGSRQPLKIIIPPGMYTPVFRQDGNCPSTVAVNGKALAESPADPPAAAIPEDPAEPPEAPVAPITHAPHRRALWLPIVGAVIVIGTAAGIVANLHTPDPRPETLSHRVSSPAVAGEVNAVRIIAGYDRKYIDHRGHTWLPDRYFEGGGHPRAPYRQFIARTSDPLLYQNGRLGVIAYNIPLKPGTYELKLHFVEPVYGPGLETGGGENSRVFDILLNGKMVIENFDIVSDANGPLIADVRVFKDVHPGPDGILRVGFHPKRERPIISAIEVEPAEPHKLNPIRIVTQPNSVADSRGQVWEADNYYLGGQSSNHFKAVTGTPDADLFANERYGHFSYAIPVAPGVYTATMYFAETYWGKENEGGGGPGQRIFDIYCDGSTLLRNFDILKEVGPNHALIKRFRGLRPTPQGKLNIDFVPAANYASVFAIEIEDESR